MAPYDSDSGDEDWTNQYDQGPDEDTSILRNGKQALGLTKKYVPTWKPGHAIREFYQNWYVLWGLTLYSSHVCR